MSGVSITRDDTHPSICRKGLFWDRLPSFRTLDSELMDPDSTVLDTTLYPGWAMGSVPRP